MRATGASWMLTNRMAAADELIVGLEWSGVRQGQGSGYMSSGGDGPLFPACPVCGNLKPGTGAEGHFIASAIGHRKGCKMAAYLKRRLYIPRRVRVFKNTG